MFLMILIIFVLLFECIYYISFVNSNVDNKIEYYREIPTNENPAIVGLMVKGNIDVNDIIATVLDLWKKGFINLEYDIIDGTEQCILKDAEKDRFLILKDYENYLLDELFKENNKVTLEDFMNSPNFEIIFKNIGNMISKRVDIKSIHKISHNKLISKINFLVNYIVLGFSIFFSFVFLVTNDFYIAVLISYVISILTFIFIRTIIIKSNYRIEQLLFGYSTIISIIYFSAILISLLISNFVYQYNLYFNICNMILGIIFVVCALFRNYDKNISYSFVDYLVFFYSIISILFMNLIGMCICIVYISHKIYIKAPNHVSLKNSKELDKWIALKQFLNDFTIIDERKITEIEIWDKYLIYAVAMGVNKKMISEYMKVSNIKLINKNIIDKYYVENVEY